MGEASKLERTLPASRLYWRAGTGAGKVVPCSSPAPVPRASPTANKSVLKG